MNTLKNDTGFPATIENCTTTGSEFIQEIATSDPKSLFDSRPDFIVIDENPADLIQIVIG